VSSWRSNPPGLVLGGRDVVDGDLDSDLDGLCDDPQVDGRAGLNDIENMPGSAVEIETFTISAVEGSEMSGGLDAFKAADWSAPVDQYR